MAYTKIFPVRHKLGRAVSYAVNPDKIQLDENDALADMVDYALDREKTETRLYESAINLLSPENTFAEMVATKEPDDSEWNRYQCLKRISWTCGYSNHQSVLASENTASRRTCNQGTGTDCIRRLVWIILSVSQPFPGCFPSVATLLPKGIGFES